MWINQEYDNFKPKGLYVIYVEDDGTVYSTNSPFWANFFYHDKPEKKSRKKYTEHNMASKSVVINKTIDGYKQEYINLLSKYPDKAEQLKKEMKNAMVKFNE